MAFLKNKIEFRKIIWNFLYMGARCIVIDTDLRSPNGDSYNPKWITKRLEDYKFKIQECYPHKATWIIVANRDM